MVAIWPFLKWFARKNDFAILPFFGSFWKLKKIVYFKAYLSKTCNIYEILTLKLVILTNFWRKFGLYLAFFHFWWFGLFETTYGQIWPFNFFWTWQPCQVSHTEPKSYKAFHRFGQAKLAYSGSILGSSQFTLLPQLPPKMMLDLKVVKIDSKIYKSLHYYKSMTHSVCIWLSCHMVLECLIFRIYVENEF